MHTARVAPEKTAFSARPADVLHSAERMEKRVSKLTYAEQLKHPNWQKRRLEMLEASSWSCSDCGDTTTTLHVHHRRYIKGRMVWEYEDKDLAVLCEVCHEREHASRKLLDVLLAASSSSAVDVCVGLLAGYLVSELEIDDELANEANCGREPYFELGVVANVMQSCGVDSWRNLVRQIAKNRQVTPAVEKIIEEWDHWEARFNGGSSQQ